jgi:hypothetical protein
MVLYLVEITIVNLNGTARSGQFHHSHSRSVTEASCHIVIQSLVTQDDNSCYGKFGNYIAYHIGPNGLIKNSGCVDNTARVLF